MRVDESLVGWIAMDDVQDPRHIGEDGERYLLVVAGDKLTYGDIAALRDAGIETIDATAHGDHLYQWFGAQPCMVEQ